MGPMKFVLLLTLDRHHRGLSVSRLLRSLQVSQRSQLQGTGTFFYSVELRMIWEAISRNMNVTVNYSLCVSD